MPKLICRHKRAIDKVHDERIAVFALPEQPELIWTLHPSLAKTLKYTNKHLTTALKQQNADKKHFDDID